MRNQVEILKEEYNDKCSYNISVSLAISQGLYEDVFKFLEKVPSSESVGAKNDIQGLLGNDNLLIKGAASDKEEGREERTPPRHEKREYSVLYETEENLKKSDSGR